MTRLTEEMVVARAKQSDLGAIKKLNCWGSDLTDVSIIKRMRSVEVLALSVNKISTLQPFEDCQKLQELYLRKNNIENINEISYLQNLPNLKYLWLGENPCCDKAGANYRAFILRALPNLKKLDNVDVTQEEIDDALRSASAGNGNAAQDEDTYEDAYTHHSPQHQQHYERQPHSPTQHQQYQHPQQQQQQRLQQQQAYYTQQQHQQHQQQGPYHGQPRRSLSPSKEKSKSSSKNASLEQVNEVSGNSKPPSPAQEYYQSDRPAYPVHYRHSQTDLTEWEEHQNNQYGSSATLYHTPRRSAGNERDERYAYRNGNARENVDWEDTERQRARRPEARLSDGASTISTAVLNHYTSFHRRPISRTSNLLSATLCLVKELDYSSLEVVEHAVRCRIDELSAE